ncbi:tyrosine-type recombinase/integrase [Thiolinea disciformis]|uniref:tyrosine-type recombinase/integrase n=1 Tax=Thiolinea disciformis TaxID=125614 RepID=UPI00037A8F11|nr:site-specific integrase [Thiolinea disciformis]
MAKQRKEGLYLRGAIWWCRYYDQNNKLQRESLDTTQHAIALERFAAKQPPARRDKPSVADVLDLYHFERGQSSKRGGYLSARRLLLAYFSGMLWEELGDVRHPRSFKQFIKERSQQVSPATVNIEIGILSAAANVAIDQQFAIKNYLTRQKLKVFEPDPIFITQDQALALLEAARFNQRKFAHHQKPTLYNWLCIALGTGMRMSEILKLQRTDVDLVQQVIRLSTSKSDKPHSIPMTQGVVAAVQRCLALSNNQWLFPSPKAGHIRTIYPQFRRACVRAGIPITNKALGVQGVRVHTTRHTVASWLVQDGVPLLQVGDLLNHSSVKTTERYAHLSPEGRAAVVGKLPKFNF